MALDRQTAFCEGEPMGGKPQGMSPDGRPGHTRNGLQALYEEVRGRSMELAAPLTAEDQCIQTMPDVSPTKWHLAHTSWFFETFILGPFDAGYGVFHPRYNYLFNSYYEAVGPRHERPKRGLLSRPPLDDIHAYRRHVDDAMDGLMAGATDGAWAGMAPLLDLGLNN